MSYVHKKLKVFDRASDVEVRRKKSDGRMKTYVSATDARAWCDSTEERRQYILDLVNYGDASGRIVPLEALMDILMAEKIAELNALKQEIQLLRDYIKSHGLELTEDQFKVESIKGEETSVVDIPEEVEEEPSIATSKSSKEKSVKSVRLESITRMSDLEEVDEERTSGEPSVREPSVKEPSAKEPSVGEPSINQPSVKEPSVREPSADEPLTEEPSQSISTIGTPSIDAASSHVSGPSAKEPSVKEPSVKEPSVREPSVREPSVKEPSVREPSIKEPSVREPSVKEPSVKEPSVKEPSVKEPSVKEPSVKDDQKSREKEIISIEDTLEIDDDNLITGQEIVEEGRTKSRSGSEVRKLSTEEKPTMEVEAFEYDMLASEPVAQAQRRSSVQEVEMVQETRPPTIEQEPALEKVEEEPKIIPEMDERCKAQFELALAAIKQLENIKDIVSTEADKPPVEGAAEETLPDGVNLEERFQKLVGLEDEVKKLKQKADKCCDSDGSTMLLERESLAMEIQRLRCKCEGSAQDADRMEQDIQNLQCQLEEARLQAREAQLLKMENCCLKVRLEHLENLHKSYEDLVERTKDYDKIKAEWTVFKTQCQQIPLLENEIFQLRARIADCDRLERERELLMKEIMDCECCIGQQGNEIDKLQCHIECLTKNLDKRQQEAKTSCSSLRAQLEEKEQIIRCSDLKLCEVQTELKASIQCVTCETTCLRNRIAELEKELAACAASKEEQANLDKAECETICLRNYIAELEEELETYRSKCDENQCLRNYIKDLKIETINLKSEMCKYQKAAEESEEIKSRIVNYEQVLKQNQEEINNLTQKLLACGDIQTDLVQTQRKLNEMTEENEKLRELINKLGNASGDDHLKNMLKQERCAVKCIIERFCTMQGTQDAIKKENEELSAQIKRLEQEYQSKFKDMLENLEDAKATIECFKICGEEDQEKDKLIEELRSKLQMYEGSEDCSCSICNRDIEDLIN